MTLPEADALPVKVALITGGSRRVGASIARELHAAGWNLLLHYRQSAAEARSLAAELNLQRAESVALVQADLNNMAMLQPMIEQAIRRFGRLDALVNNASSFYPTAVGSITEKDWDELVGSNMKAPLFLSQAAAPELKRTHGCIVNIVDIHAERPLKGYPVYSVAKAGLVGLTRAFARELGPEVRVNGVAPGPIMWPDGDEHFDEVSRQRIVSHTLLKRSGEAEDVARTVKFLICDAPYITGQIIAVDGGRSVNL